MNNISHSHRIEEIDFLKCVFILLMIAFHLSYIEHLYPYAKNIVFTFHMPAFLFISGYLFNINKKWNVFLRSIKWIFIPYAIMEGGYVIMASFLPIQDHIDHISFLIVLNKVFLHPLGSYWYLHTLMLCGLLYYGVFKVLHLEKLSSLIIFGLCLYFCSYYLHIVSFYSACYFFAGVVVRQSGLTFLQVVRPSALSILPVILMAAYPQNLSRSTIAGAIMVYLVMSICLFCFKYIKGKMREGTLFIGRNTLIIFLFSPIFTLLAKQFLPFLAFDHSGMLFLFLSLAFTLAGCFLVAYGMDWLNISRFFFGKARVVLGKNPE